MIEYCKNCGYPTNHALGLTLHEKTKECSGCLVHKEKYEIDWQRKKEKLGEIISQKTAGQNSTYDCIVPVFGTGDDYFLVHYLKANFDINPLLVSYNTHFSTKVGIRNLARLISELDCEHVHLTVGPATVKKIVNTTLNEIGDVYWHVQIGIQAFATQVAVKLKVPLVFWPVNGWLDQVGKFSHHHNVEMTKKIWEEFSGRSFLQSDILKSCEGLSNKDLIPFEYPSFEQIQSIGVRGIYLNNFIFWDSKIQTEKMMDLYGFESRLEERTFNYYETAHCWVNAGVQDFLKDIKFGYSKIHDHTARDIRLGRLNSEQGRTLIQFFQDKKPEAIESFLEWTARSEKQFNTVVEQFRNKGVWHLSGDVWKRKLSIQNDDSNSELHLDDILPDINRYRLTSPLEEENSDQDFILSGRTYLDEKNYAALGG